MEKKDKHEEFWTELREQESAVILENENLLKELGITEEAFNSVTQDCYVPTLPYEIVSEPKGTNQFETHFMIKNVWIEQWGVGMEGDSFEGYIYMEVSKDKWLKIRYSC